MSARFISSIINHLFDSIDSRNFPGLKTNFSSSVGINPPIVSNVDQSDVAVVNKYPSTKAFLEPKDAKVSAMNVLPVPGTPFRIILLELNAAHTSLILLSLISKVSGRLFFKSL